MCSLIPSNSRSEKRVSSLQLFLDLSIIREKRLEIILIYSKVNSKNICWFGDLQVSAKIFVINYRIIYLLIIMPGHFDLNNLKQAIASDGGHSPSSPLSSRANQIRIVLLGATGVGKSAIVSRFVNGSFPEKYIPTGKSFTGWSTR